MAKKIIDDSKHDAFIEKAWKDYQKSQKKSSGKGTKGKTLKTAKPKKKK